MSRRLWRGEVAPVAADHAAAGDLLRAACVFLVGWYHIWQQSWLSPVLRLGPLRLNFTAPVRAGYLFVDLMLLLSGFLLYLPYAAGKERPVRSFFLRRALRILPSYWLCLAVMFAFALAEGEDLRRMLVDVAAHLGFVHNLFAPTYLHTRLNGVLWTLAVEVQFYLLLPALAPLFRRRPALCYAAMTAAAFSFRFLWTAPMEDTPLYVNRLPNMLDVYANGMLAAHLYAKLAACRERRGLMAAAGTALCALGAWGIWRVVGVQAGVSGFENIRQGQLYWRFPLSLSGAAFLLGGSLSFAPVRAALSNRIVRFFSGISFNFYIWHQWLAVRLKQWRVPPYAAEVNPNQAGEMPWQLHYTLLCFAAAIALATLLTYLVERPCARWGRERWDRRGSK